MRDPGISVIMPAYNSEQFIQRSINCVRQQSYSDWELIIVDDGSTDSTGKICDEYALTDSRIKVFHKNNGGVASARQLGLDNATGEYTIHFDADDEATPEMLGAMYETAKCENADVVVADFYERWADGRVFYEDQYFSIEKSSELINAILTGYRFGSLWNKMIRRSALVDLNVSFDPDINYCEDVLLEAKLLKDDKLKVVYHKGAYYTYCRENPNSISIKYDRSKLEERMKFLDRITNVLDREQFHDAITAHAWNIKMDSYRNGCLALKEFDSIYPHSITYILHSAIGRRMKLKLAGYSLIHKVCNGNRLRNRQ